MATPIVMTGDLPAAAAEVRRTRK